MMILATANEFWEKALLGLIQGLTEFLPISSSGHLLATKEILGCEAGLALDVALHVATLAAVVIYFFRDLVNIFKQPRWPRTVMLIGLATVPGAALGYMLSEWRDQISPWWVVGGWSFSCLYLITSKGRGGTGKYVELPLWRGVLVGMAQALAIFPGVSRAGSSIVSGLWLGLEKEQAFRFSFLLSIPLILGAGLNTARHLTTAELDKMGGISSLVLGMIVAFAVGMGAIHFLLRIVRANKLHHFGWYNLTAAALFALYLILR